MAENRQLIPAVYATILFVQVPTGNIETVPFDRYILAFRTVSVLPAMSRHISDINKSQPFLSRNFAMLFQCFDGRVWNIHHFIVWMESQEMYWRIWSKIIIQETA